MSLSQAVLLSLLVVHSAIAQSTLDGYDMCYGDGTICDAWHDFEGCSSLINDNDKYWACRCGDDLPLQFGCSECRYEYGMISSLDIDTAYYSSKCSSEGESIGTIPESVLASISSHTATISVLKSTTLHSNAAATSTNTQTSATGAGTDESISTTAQTSATGAGGTEESTGWWYSTWTSTYGPSMEITPLATAPASVQDIPSDGSGGKAMRDNMFVGGAFILGAGLLLG